MHIKGPIVLDYQVERLFPKESKHQITVHLSQLVRSGALKRIKRGMYTFAHMQPDEFVLANSLYRPSYVSLESALNYYGIIPDIAVDVTSVSPTTTKQINTPLGHFLYSKISKKLFFGYRTVADSTNMSTYMIAESEKALVDYVYVRKLADITGQRMDLSGVDRKKVIMYGRLFPTWVLDAINEQYHH